MKTKKSIKLIYFPLVKESANERLILKELSDILLKFNDGIELIKRDFPQLGVSHSLGDEHYFGGGPVLDTVKVLQYHINLLGDEESLKGASSSFMDCCGIPYGVGKDFKLLDEYLNKNGKRIKRRLLDFCEQRKPIVDKKK